MQEHPGNNRPAGLMICDACLSQKGCRRCASNKAHGAVVTNCKPPQFRWSGAVIEGLYCHYELRKGIRQEKHEI